MNLYLGVDGGGTSTDLCLVSAAGAVLAVLQAPSCYYLGKKPGQEVGRVAAVLGEAVAALTTAAGTQPSAISYGFFGLPAYGEVSSDRPLLDAAPRRALGHERYRCDNDMVCGWAGSLLLADGINVISGTGSMTYGRRRDRGLRVGGWGELFGDEGSGYWVGSRGLQAFSRMSDGRLAPGPLLDVFRAHLHLSADLDAVDVVLNHWQGSRREIAALSRPVVEAARRGDPVARDILTEAADELALLVETTAHRLGFTGAEDVTVSYSGGMFAVPEVLSSFGRRLTGGDFRVDLREPQLPPVLGAALYAAELAGTPLSGAALDRLRGEAAAQQAHAGGSASQARPPGAPR